MDLLDFLFSLLHVSTRGFLCILLATLLLFWYLNSKRRSGLPPGPRTLPLIGNLHQLTGNRISTRVTALGKPYGDIFTIYMGQKPFVVLNSYEVIKEAFVKQRQYFSNRPNNIIRQEISEYLGIVMNDGQMWKEQRVFALNHLKELGLGKLSFEPVIQEEIRALVTAVTNHHGRPFDIQTLITNAVANIISHIVLGCRFDYGNRYFDTILDSIHTFSTKGKTMAMMDIFPMLSFFKYLPGDMLNYHAIKQSIANSEILLQKVINEHRDTLDDTYIRDFIDSFLIQQKKDKASGKESSFTDKQLLKVLNELFIGGLETTSTALRWTILFLMKYPDTQRRAQKEIDGVIGHGRLPSLNDRDNLPYCEALINEVQRISTIEQLGMMHSISEDVFFHGFNIPAGTGIIQNLGATKMDSNIWTDPEKFDPERFRDISGKFCQNEKFIPFGIGPRQCIGKALATMELFLFVTSLLQHFDFIYPEDAPPLSLEGISGITYSPLPYTLCAVPR